MSEFVKVMIPASRSKRNPYPARDSGYEVCYDKVSGALAVRKAVDGGYTEYRTFMAGDTVVTGSYNLTYLDPIISLTDKTVTVSKVGYSSNRRMSMHEFCYYNYKTDVESLAVIRDENMETSYYI